MEEVQQLDAKIYHLGSLLADDFSPEVVKCLAQKGRISIDAQGYLREVRGEDVFPIDWADKRDILAYTDILKVNEHEMEVITGCPEPLSLIHISEPTRQAEKSYAVFCLQKKNKKKLTGLLEKLQTHRTRLKD